MSGEGEGPACPDGPGQSDAFCVAGDTYPGNWLSGAADDLDLAFRPDGPDHCDLCTSRGKRYTFPGIWLTDVQTVNLGSRMVGNRDLGLRAGDF